MKKVRLKFLFLIPVAVFVFVATLILSSAKSSVYALTPEDIETDGTVFEIAAAEDFSAFAEYSESHSTYGKTFILTSDIDLTTLSSVNSVGSTSYPFSGTFDGNGKAVTVNVEATDYDYSGLFGHIGRDGTVRSLTVKGSVSGDRYVGGIAGYNTGTVSDCENEAVIVGKSYVGGIVGSNSGTVTNCYNGSSVTGTEYTGGIAGDNTGVISSCINSGKVAATSYVGGVVGKSSGNNASISSCVNAGELSASTSSTSARYVGGMAGDTSATIKNCYNYAAISVSGISIGSAIGNLTSVDSSCGNVYNVGGKSSRGVVGSCNVTVPSEFRSVSTFEVFTEGSLFDETMVLPTAEVGYAYLAVPAAFFEKTEKLSALRIKIFSSGEGTTDNPFVINDEEDFVLFGKNAALYDYNGVVVKLGEAIDAGEINPLGVTLSDDGKVDTATEYNGTFDGDGKMITYSVSNDYIAALFGVVGENGLIKNLSVTATVTGKSLAGGIAGELKGKAENLLVYGTVTGESYVGGVAGKITSDKASVAATKNYAKVSGNNFVGGIFGYAEKAYSLTNLVNNGLVAANNGLTFSCFGGIGGKADAVTNKVSSLINKAAVLSYKATGVGGIFGYVGAVEAESLFVTADVSGKIAVGGIAGDGNGTTIKDAGVIAKISGAEYVGGMVGRSGDNGANIASSYFNGTFGTVSEAAIKKDTFRTIAQSGTTLSDVYYNSDLIFEGTDGQGKNYVELTSGIMKGENWVSSTHDYSYGILPIIKAEDVYGDNAVMQSKARYDYFDGGDGTESNPFVINGEQQYRNAAILTASFDDYNDFCYVIGSKIDFERKVPTIGGENGFRGTFDGSYKELGKAYFDTAMFNTLASSAVVKNVALESGKATIASFAEKVESGASLINSYSLLNVDGTAVGGLVGENAGTVSGCLYFGRISGETAGGLVCKNTGKIIGCVFGGYAEGKTVGGAAGENDGDVTGCVINGVINGLVDERSTGGFFGTINVRTTDQKFFDDMFLGTILINGTKPASEGGAFFAGTLKGAVPTISVIFNSDEGGIGVTYYGSDGTAVNGAFYKRATADIVKDDFLNNFTNTEFVSGGARDYESDYAPINKLLSESECERIAGLARKGSAIYLFGRDYISAYETGSEQNPYLISTATQFATLSDLTKAYDYSGKYFALANDIDFKDVSFMPIGRYYGVGNGNNYFFNGSIDGRFYSVKNLKITNVPSGSSSTEQTASSNVDSYYVGFVSYGGESFVLKNLFVDESCSVTSVGNVGSLVGYHKGTINDCISYAAVSGTGYVGGIAAYAENNASITSTVFGGSLVKSGEFAGYGITGQNANTVTLNTTGSFYLYRNEEDKFISVGKEPYDHNDYGDALFVDRGGKVEAVFEDGKLMFVITADSTEAKPAVMTAQNKAVFSGEKFAPSVLGDGSVSAKYYVRFTFNTEIAFYGVSDGLVSADYGKGYFYEGQSVKFVLRLKDGIFVSEHGDAAVTNEGDSVALSFTVSATDGKCALPVKLESVTDYYEIKTEKETLIYDGEVKKFVASVKEGKTNLFEEFEYELYDEDGNKTENMLDAGEYSAVVRLYPVGKNYFVGLYRLAATVERAELILSDSDDEYWTEFANKDYDGLSSSEKTVDGDKLTGIISSDIGKVIVNAEIVWKNTNVGKTSATVRNFVTAGEKGKNYKITQGKIEVSDVTIGVRQVTITVEDGSLSASYDGNKPSVRNYSLSFGVTDVNLVWTFALLKDESNETDEEWAALADGKKTWDVGRYALTASFADGNAAVKNAANYKAVTAESYIFTIEKRLIDEVSYAGYEHLTYTGENLSSYIRGQYDSANGGINLVKFVFFADEQETEEVINAGTYKAEPHIEDKNYVLDENVPSLIFTVAKAKGEALTFELSTEKLTIGKNNALISSLSDYHDAVLSVETVASGGDGRGKANIEIIDGKHYFVPVAYPTSGDFRFRLKASGSKNYEDRYSEEKVVYVEAGTIFVGLDKNNTEVVFGDEIRIKVVYSFDKEQTDIIDDPTAISNFVAPEYQLKKVTGVGTCEVSFYGGSSDGYKISTGDYHEITVKKRALNIVIIPDAENKKIYGEADGEIEYIINDAVSGEKIDVLPDGTEIKLNGKLSRTAGEDADKYAINKGTLTDENNPDYHLTYSLSDRYYTIEKKRIEIVIDAKKKYYGEEDPAFTFSLADGYEYGFTDDATAVRVEIRRESGEDAGSYGYVADYYDGGRNYTIARVDASSNRFFIEKATPTITYIKELMGVIRYGDKYSVLKMVGEACTEKGTVNGSFRITDGETVADNVGVVFVGFEFVPADRRNYATVYDYAAVDCLPRIAEISFDGESYYVYNGSVQGGRNITATVNNAINGDTFTFDYAYSELNPKSVGKYTVTVKGLGNDKYVFADKYSDGQVYEYEIQPATVTVTVEDAKIKEGDKFTPKISYDGFVGGEGTSVLTSVATVSVPKNAGIFEIKAEGAAAENYKFKYVAATLVIEKTYLVSDNVSIKGELGASLTLSTVKSEATALTNNAADMDKALKYNLFIPNLNKVKEYYELRYNGKAAGEFDYAVNLNLSSGNKLYVKYYDGTVAELTDYELLNDGEKNEDGTVTVTFRSEQVSAVAVYEAKSIVEILKGFLPIGGVALGVVIVVIIIVAVAYGKHKKYKKEREYLSRYDRY